MTASDGSESAAAPVRLVARLASLVWWLLLSVLVLLAIYVGVGRQLTQNINDYRATVEQRLSAQLGQEVSIGTLAASWQWLDPVLEARDVRVHGPGASSGVAGSLQHLRVRLDSLASLFRFRLVFGDFEADGLELTLTRDSAGEIAVRGVPADGLQSGDLSLWLDRAGAWLSDPSVRITRVDLGIRTDGSNIRYVSIPQLDLVYSRGLFHIAGRAMRSGTTEQLASFRLVGRHFFRGDFTGQAYLELSSGRWFDELVGDLAWRDLSAEGFDVGGRAWFTFQDGRLQQATGRLETPYLQLRSGEASLAPLEAIGADFGWRRPDNPEAAWLAGDFHLRNLTWRWNGETVKPFSLRLHRDPEGVTAYGHGITVGPLARLVDTLNLLPERFDRALGNYQPEGQLDNLSLRVPAAGGFELVSGLVDAGVSAYRGAPGASGLSGVLMMDRSGGQVRVRGDNASLGFPQLFANAWTFDHVEAAVGWRLEGPVTRVFSDDITMHWRPDGSAASESPDGADSPPDSGTARLTGAFDLRLDRDGEDNLGLKVAVENGSEAMLAEFVPVHVVSPALYEWLNIAITDARIDDGEFYGHGLIGESAGKGSFGTSMRYRFRDATVRYDPRWPAAEQVSGEVIVNNASARVTLDQARIGGLDLASGAVRVSPANDGTTVFVDASAPVPGEAVGFWMTNSPLGEMAGAAAANLKFAGNYQLDLALGIPLGSQADPDVDVSIATAGGAVTYEPAGLQWRDLQGRVSYNSGSGFAGEPLAGRFMDHPVRIGLSRAEGNALRIRQTGALGVAEASTAPWWPLPGATGLAGSINYTATLDASPETASAISFYSGLQDLAVDWPMPLGKAAGEEQPLKAVLDLADERGPVLSGVLQDRLAFRMLWADGQFQRGRVALGTDAVELPEANGLVISGPLAVLDIGLWQAAFDRLEAAPGDAGPGQASAGATGVRQWFRLLELELGELRVAGQAFPDIAVTARPTADSWLIDTRSQRATGRITIPDSPLTPVNVDFQQLGIAPSNGEDPSRRQFTVDEQLEAFRALALENWPDIDVRIADLRLGEESLGQWSFGLRPQPTLLRVEALRGNLRSLAFDGELAWSIAGERERTRLTGQLTGGGLSDLEGLLTDEMPLRNQKTEIALDLEWPGRPDGFGLDELSGDVSLRLDDGVILEQNSTAQLFRIFNILNSDNLWRRLRLDFSDLYEAGVAFDALSGKAVLTSGNLTLDPELQIVGPSGAFKLSGSTNLAEETLNMRLVVVLPLTQNLPLAAILLGAAPLGGALFVLDKVLGDPLSKLTSATYSVSGSWDEPDVRLRNVFDTGE